MIDFIRIWPVSEVTYVESQCIPSVFKQWPATLTLWRATMKTALSCSSETSWRYLLSRSENLFRQIFYSKIKVIRQKPNWETRSDPLARCAAQRKKFQFFIIECDINVLVVYIMISIPSHKAGMLSMVQISLEGGGGGCRRLKKLSAATGRSFIPFWCNYLFKNLNGVKLLYITPFQQSYMRMSHYSSPVLFWIYTRTYFFLSVLLHLRVNFSEFVRTTATEFETFPAKTVLSK